MRIRHALRAGLAALALIAGTALVQSAGAAPAAAADPVRIMPLGDSITGSPGCWRAELWNQLQDAGYTGIDFVGTLPPQGCGAAHDGDNEGHGGFLATRVASENQLPGWLSATRPDVVMMHFGTNDVWSGIAPDTILAAYSTLLDQMRAQNPDITLLVAQIIPMNPSQCGECAQRVADFNERIPGWAQSVSTDRSPVIVVDQWTGFSTATDTYDGVHPNAAGDDKIAARWFPALAQVLDSAAVTTGTTTTTSEGATSSTSEGSTSEGTSEGTTTGSTTTGSETSGGSDGGLYGTSSAIGGAGRPETHVRCSTSGRVVSSWPGGFQGEVTVTNAGENTWGSWTASLTLHNGAELTQLWNASVTGVTEHGSIRIGSLSWNGALGAGQSATYGFIASLPAGAGVSGALGCSGVLP
ncbi:GDSL-type esterase/lipase family protein [Streptomyces sp. YIM 98790]|uniref:GDSL-type esterase/lipase family protein n=1 Tax=Streptomyces sp. YIM 98790 TaxID=2689077 RepID=UPI0028BDC967|nr:GDSL-type esterase/lipase family protein [Streptomyces sp. YIM 98790]